MARVESRCLEKRKTCSCPSGPLTVESVSVKRLPSPRGSKIQPKIEIEGMDRRSRRLKDGDCLDAHVEVRTCLVIKDQVCTRRYDTRRTPNIRFDQLRLLSRDMQCQRSGVDGCKDLDPMEANEICRAPT